MPRARLPRYAAPATLRRQLQQGENIDFDALLDWYMTKCPDHLKALAIDNAALLSVFPPFDQMSSSALSISIR